MTHIVPFTAPIDDGVTIDLNKKTIDKIALIDADRYKHVVAYRMWQKLMDEGHDHSHSLVNEVIDDYLSNDIFNRFEAKAYIFCFSAPSSKVFRNHIAQVKKYKGTRKSSDKYFYTNKYDDMAYVFDYIASRYTTLYYDDLEADDLLSLLQREETFIFSHDKDLKQVPGWHWDMNSYQLYRIDEDDAFKNLMYQILTGDATDNITGLQGFGKVALEQFKIRMKDASPEALFHSVLKEYTNKYGLMYGFDTFVEMWTLISMRMNRGEYCKDSYNQAFYTIETLCKKLFDDNADAKSNGDDENS